MSYDIENFEKPEDRKKGLAGTTIFHILLLLLIVWPWFSTVYPIPEAEGLMASFGDVEVAGGGEESTDPVEEPIEEPVEEPIEEPVEETVEEVETIDDNETPAITEDKPKVEESKPKTESNKPKVNNNALFTKKGNGKGTGTGSGTQGRPDGKGDLGGTGNGEKGNGSGKIGSRRNISKCDDYKKGNASWQERGKAVVKICVNAKGRVTSAKIVRRKSTITSQTLIDLVEGCAQNYRYEKVPGAPDACGEITIQLGLK